MMDFRVTHAFFGGVKEPDAITVAVLVTKDTKAGVKGVIIKSIIFSKDLGYGAKKKDYLLRHNRGNRVV